MKGSSGVSRRHCKVQLVSDRYVVIDLESRNGTVVNGETVARKFLSDNDLLEIGDEHVRFIAKPRAGAKAPAGPPPLDSDDIEDQPTALASPVAVQQPIVKPTPPSNASATTPKKGPGGSANKGPTPDGNTSRKTAPEKVSARPAGAQPTPKKAPQPPPLPRADIPSDQTASFVMDPAFLTPKVNTSLSAAAARDAMNAGGNTLENQPPELEEADEPSAPYTLQPQKRRSGGVIVALLVMVLLVLGLVGVAAWDVMFAERRVVALLRARAPAAAVFLEKNVPYLGPSSPRDDVVASSDAGPTTTTTTTTMDAGAIAVATVDAGDVVEATDAGTVVALAPVDAGVNEVRDAGSTVIAPVVDAGSKPVASTDAAEITVGASSGGRVASIRVKVGDVVKKGQTLALLEAAGGLRRKLESLREEERAFEAAVKKGNKAARRDLEQVRADIAELSRKTRGAPLVSDADGTVVQVIVRDGATIKAGDPVVTLRK